MDIATRELFWQISAHWFFYLLSGVSLLVFLWGLQKCLTFVMKGVTFSDNRPRKFGLSSVFKEILTHRTLGSDDPSRWWHLLVFYGFGILFVVTCCIMIAHYGWKGIFQGTPYLLLTLAAELGGVVLLAGSLIALVQWPRDGSEDRKRIIERGLLLGLFILICLTGFLLEGLRLHLKDDPWWYWSPVGEMASWVFLLVSQQGGITLFKCLWWVHSLLVLVLIAWIPFSSRVRHMIFLPIHRAMAPRVPPGPISTLNFEEIRNQRLSKGAVRLGIETTTDTSRMQRLGLLACMDCGRCENLCPAFQTGQPLSPRRSLQDLRDYVKQYPAGEKVGEINDTKQEVTQRAPEAVSAPALWACRLCMACEESCPAGIGHVSQLMELRQADVLGHGMLPQEAGTTLISLARTGNPYGAFHEERSAWIQNDKVPTGPQENAEAILLWTGCIPPGDEQKVRVLSSLAALLKGLEIPYFVLPQTSTCCGEPARILGDEDLFQSIARDRIEKIRETGVTSILAHCPHCYTVLKDIYPIFGTDFKVLHTSEFFLDHIRGNRLRLKDVPQTQSMVYHDPCFLGRYQGLYEPPREILQALPGVELRELERSREKAFCCGAGGGHYYMDLDVTERPASQRMAEILDTHCQTLAVSCSFCFSMFDDALRRLPDPVPLEVTDWLELLEAAVDFSPQA